MGLQREFSLSLLLSCTPRVNPFMGPIEPSFINPTEEQDHTELARALFPEWFEVHSDSGHKRLSLSREEVFFHCISHLGSNFAFKNLHCLICKMFFLFDEESYL